MNLKKLKDQINEMPIDVQMAGMTMSVCAAYIHEQLIAASRDELCSALRTRWKESGVSDNDAPSEEHLTSRVGETIEWALKMGALERSIVPGKYSPTDHGWRIAELWIDRINSCTFHKEPV